MPVKRRGSNILTLLALIWWLPQFANAQDATGNPSHSGTSQSTLPDDDHDDPPRLSDRHDVAAFLDGFLTAQLAEEHVAGAAVAVVLGDKIIYSGGFGYADVQQQTKVDPATTMFRVGSVSKLFLWTAVMKLVEQGKLDLDEDVNTYLAGSGILVPDTFERPITVKDLMCHTPGFDDYVIGLFARGPQDLKPIEQLMRLQLPERVRPPGDLASYSNHGSLLAAVIVQQISGMSWEEFVRKQILDPLQLANTTLDQPPQDQLPQALCHGYTYNGGSGTFNEQGFEYIPAAPAGCVSASAEDMARFMIAHLNQGKFNDARILQAATVAQMHSRSHWHDQRLDAMCHGFWELHRNGQRILQHGGDTQIFHSLLAILPDQKVGIFVSYNTDTGAGLREPLLNAFLDRYFPVDQARPAEPQDLGEPTDRFAGTYKTLRYDQSTITKIAMLLQVLKVKAEADNQVSVNGKSYLQVEPLLFRQQHGPETIVFREDDAGHITHLFINSAPALSFERTRWYESQVLQIGLFAASCLVLLSVIIGWPLVHVITQGEWIAGETPTIWSRRASWFGWLVAIAFAAFLIMFALQVNEVVHGISPLLRILLLCAPLLGILTLGVILFSIASWRGRFWRLGGRLHYLLLALASVGLIWQLSFWNILKFNA